MHTNKLLSRSIGVAATPAHVLGLVGDPLALPRWAPRFADAVRPGAGARWTIASGGEEFEIRVVASPEAGTVDFLAPDEDRGLFTRVVPSGEGSAVTFALVVPAATPDGVVEREGATLEQELAAIQELCAPEGAS
jgi:Polyketide cyclase / dehydrase and lipid transport